MGFLISNSHGCLTRDPYQSIVSKILKNFKNFTPRFNLNPSKFCPKLSKTRIF